MLFRDRSDAGTQLAQQLTPLRAARPVVVGLPRGGVPVAFAVAERLGAELDVILVRKLGVPFQPELAMGAIGEDGVRTINAAISRATHVGDDELAAVEAREREELERRARRYRGDAPRVPLGGRLVIVVDDGIATGSTARAACLVARALGAARIILAVPVAPPGWDRDLAGAADDYVCVATPERFFAIGQWYTDFSQTTDDQVLGYLAEAKRWVSGTDLTIDLTELPPPPPGAVPFLGRSRRGTTASGGPLPPPSDRTPLAT